MTDYSGSSDSGSGREGVNLSAHITGDPASVTGFGANATAGHTWLIIIVALAILWLFGGVIFKSIRMG